MLTSALSRLAVFSSLAWLARAWLSAAFSCVLFACAAPESAAESTDSELEGAVNTPHGDLTDLHPAPPPSFQEAKLLAMEVYADHRETLYCGCAFDEHKVVLPESCGYVPRQNGERARRVEWEHVVPAATFGRHRACWRDETCRDEAGRAVTGRACCAALDPEFRAMEADLQNLVPAIGELNLDRSDRWFGLVPGESRAYGRCDFEVDVRENVVEPRESVRGDVARIALYMHAAYGESALPLSDDALFLLWEWQAADPPDAWERERNSRIGELQGEINPLVGLP